MTMNKAENRNKTCNFLSVRPNPRKMEKYTGIQFLFYLNLQWNFANVKQVLVIFTYFQYL